MELGFIIYTKLIPADSQDPLLMPMPHCLAYFQSLFAWLFAASFSLSTPLWMHMLPYASSVLQPLSHSLPSPKNPHED